MLDSFRRSRKGEPAGLMNWIIIGAIALATLFLLLPTIVMPYFNTSYNYTITGLSASVTQGILLLVFFLALLGFAVKFIPKIGK
jgi:hypothetical protein